MDGTIVSEVYLSKCFYVCASNFPPISAFTSLPALGEKREPCTVTNHIHLGCGRKEQEHLWWWGQEIQHGGCYGHFWKPHPFFKFVVHAMNVKRGWGLNYPHHLNLLVPNSPQLPLEGRGDQKVKWLLFTTFSTFYIYCFLIASCSLCIIIKSSSSVAYSVLCCSPITLLQLATSYLHSGLFVHSPLCESKREDFPSVPPRKKINQVI